MRFYRIDWPARGATGKCTDWATTLDEAHRIGRANSDYYKVILVEVPDKKSEVLRFLKENVRGQQGAMVKGERCEFGG